MNTSSVSRNSGNQSESRSGCILVWDAPVRLFHWLFAACFAGAWLTAESESWRLIHVALGYTAGGLLVFRLAWGIVGTKYARFSSFVRGPRRVWGYLAELLRGHPQRHIGHNPAGAVAIIAMLAAASVLIVSGWATYSDVGGNWLEEVHEALAYVLASLIGVHIAGVIVSSWVHRENLIRAMVTGRKSGRAHEGIARSCRSIAAVMAVAVLAFWWWQWQVAPSPVTTGGNAAAAHRTHHEGAD
ncbi:cytochrome b/b6 domain-containing protein [Caballeronia glebae]|uniref:cytochrome b/b6 domain-containing protein n=1 Tax=Caballeronia glebae TaxID=1777143 RepID=UPI0038BC5667